MCDWLRVLWDGIASDQFLVNVRRTLLARIPQARSRVGRTAALAGEASVAFSR